MLLLRSTPLRPRALLLLCLLPAHEAYLLPPLAHRPALAATARCRHCIACADASEQPAEPLRARDLSKELAKYDTRRLRITQSGPVRFGRSLLRDAGGGLRSLAGVGGGVLDAVPVHQGLLGLTALAFAAQQSLGQAAMLAGARINAAITQGGQWCAMPRHATPREVGLVF